MGETIARQALVNAFNSMAKEEPEFIGLVANVHQKLNSDFYNSYLVDAIMQKHRSGFDIYDAYAFIEVWCALHLGAVLWTVIELGEEPSGDKNVLSNNKKLQRLFPPFRAEFQPSTGKGYNDDGTLFWDEPIKVGGKSSEGVEFETEISPQWRAPLEVGYTMPETTIMHLKEQHILARWPYGHKLIYLFYKDNFNLWKSDINGPVRAYDNWTPSYKNTPDPNCQKGTKEKRRQVIDNLYRQLTFDESG